MTATPRKSSPAKPTSVAAWKKSSTPPLVEMPSGNWMRVKKIGMQALIKTGVMPNSLLRIAEKAVNQGKKEGLDDSDLVDLLADQGKVAEIGRFMDEVTMLCAYEPTIHPLPPEGVEKDDNLLYVDEVEDEDKMFIFQVVTGGTTDLEAFREQASSTMASLRGREDVELPAE
jgi:DNA helicase TIP49 (TBP-interacting protein)